MPTPVPSTLLIWEQVPESTDLYVIPNDTLDDDAREVLTRAHGYYINGDTPPLSGIAINCISAALTDNPDHLPDEHAPGSKWAQRWSTYKQDPKTPLAGTHITHVVRCGFLL